MCASGVPGDINRGWLPETRPARRPGSEIRGPATLVEAVLYAPADVGSIPTVSTGLERIGFGQRWADHLHRVVRRRGSERLEVELR